MKNITIVGNHEQPNIILDKKKGAFEFTGKSLVEDVTGFYRDIIEWLETYGQSPNPETKVIFKMVYYNTASAKIIIQTLSIFEKMHKAGHKVNVEWHFMTDDEDMEDDGTEFSQRFTMPFELISYEGEW